MGVVSVFVLGSKKAQEQMKKKAEAFGKKIQLVIKAGALKIHTDAVKSVQRGPKTGNVYGNHQASAAGEAPATDTGFLASNIIIITDTDGWGARIMSRAAYSWYLEFGTKQIAPRPFMHPAFEKNRAWIDAKIKQVFAANEEK